MRITNKIMQNNSLYNINLNKELEDKLATQMTNQSKIARPSDDPVVAIRALRLRTNVSTVSQYYDKNAPDADSWLTVTADALNTVNDVLTDLYSQSTGAANKFLTSSDMQIYLSQMESLTGEFYASANVDFAGRYVFAGYRTNTPITFTKEQINEMAVDPINYEINEQIAFEDVTSFSFTDWSTYTSELDVNNTTLYKMRLSYDELVEEPSGHIEFLVGTTHVAATQYPDALSAYQAIRDDTSGTQVAYIPSTGEIVFSEKFYDTKMSEGQTYSIKYNKDSSTFEKGDINPVHYFNCTATYYTRTPKTEINYNKEGLTQDILYDVGYNQEIQVNTQAHEVFSLDLQRDIDDFKLAQEELKNIETKMSELENRLKGYTEGTTDYIDCQNSIDAMDKAYTFVREKVQKMFENQITKYQKYMDDTHVAITDNGTRGSRLELINSRLMNQKSTFKDLQSNNEDVDVTEVAVQLSSSKLTYDSALMATSKIMQTNLMNYI